MATKQSGHETSWSSSNTEVGGVQCKAGKGPIGPTGCKIWQWGWRWRGGHHHCVWDDIHQGNVDQISQSLLKCRWQAANKALSMYI